ncbi:LapA family protein [Falsiroseomonas sp. HW251]|uniref:LapA family protein n=1 Tax=Falsiroseomonas sp. HW251 TaxID=3390998 RepID=UPI003D313424
MRWFLFVPLLLVLALFAVSNQGDVELRLWPFDPTLVAPLGVTVLVLAGVGFLLGALIAWSAALPARRRAVRYEQAARLLEGELAALKAREGAARRAADTGRVTEAELVPALGARR